MERFIITVACADAPGIVHAVTEVLVRLGGNIVESQQFTSPDSGTFFLRIEVDAPCDREQLEAAMAPVKERFTMELGLHRSADRVRTLIMGSKDPRTLNEVLFDHHLGQLNIDVPLVVSNHMDLKKHADFYGVDYEHVPITKDTKTEAEARLLELIEEHDIELVVLARYMQILSDELAEKLAGRAINIHHSFLPAFKGARPYHQAHSRGVKLIGATAHYVTADLDEGPIIEQNVVRVDHTKSPDELIAIGRNVEGRTLAQAVRWHAEHRVLMDGTRTVVFS
ncbi:Formyltetrahydrofolate deformylase [Brevibacterium ravenspurgense]|uniref:Formyltetrahydrofolate deformylase n=1 Tax=Brevibacterium ravenspurgense TaxID=479117 RepID=A0A150H8P4_9MICO|nr:formyltetrahydrofolate deformylase [Brevibacterium ravenspurgense]KXZ58469.1 Formyltetrahydrofolate deformylase [Brevibacterium ravenspurgense]